MSWIEAGKSVNAKVYIHPSGWSTELYKSSGKETAKMIQKYIKTGEKVLEYGCGNGRLMRHLTDCKLRGVDIVPEFVNECIKEGLDATLIKEYDFNGDLDVIYCITVFIHLSKQDGKEALINICKGLKVGGIALLQIPIYDENKDPNCWIDVGTWTEELLRKTCDEIGFDIVELHKNSGAFSYENIGENHDKVQILKKK